MKVYFLVCARGWERLHLATCQVDFRASVSVGRSLAQAGGILPSVFLSFLKEEQQRCKLPNLLGRPAHKEAIQATSVQGATGAEGGGGQGRTHSSGSFFYLLLVALLGLLSTKETL